MRLRSKEISVFNMSRAGPVCLRAGLFYPYHPRPVSLFPQYGRFRRSAVDEVKAELEQASARLQQASAELEQASAELEQTSAELEEVQCAIEPRLGTGTAGPAGTTRFL